MESSFAEMIFSATFCSRLCLIGSCQPASAVLTAEGHLLSSLSFEPHMQLVAPALEMV